MDQENRWTALDRLIADHGFCLPAAAYAELATLLREAIEAKDPAQGQSLNAQLAEIVRTLYHKASPEARAATALDTGHPATPAGQAYTLGRFGFASQLAADLADRRADARFEEILRSDTFGPYARALYAEDLSGKQLADLLGQAEETVSRNLKVLKHVGAVDYRRKRTSFINFLTPAARQILAAEGSTTVRSRLADPVRAWAQSEAREILPIMREAQTFAQVSEANRQEAALVDE